MSDQKNILIVLLLISAALLSTMLFIANRTEQTAQATGSSDRFGDYLMCPGQRESSADNVYVIDTQQQKLIVYIVEPGTNDLGPVDIIDLARYFSR